MGNLLTHKVGRPSQLSTHQQAKLSVKSVKVIRCVYISHMHVYASIGCPSVEQPCQLARLYRRIQVNLMYIISH